jgi:hypothetical protein
MFAPTPRTAMLLLAVLAVTAAAADTVAAGPLHMLKCDGGQPSRDAAETYATGGVCKAGAYSVAKGIPTFSVSYKCNPELGTCVDVANYNGDRCLSLNITAPLVCGCFVTVGGKNNVAGHQSDLVSCTGSAATLYKCADSKCSKNCTKVETITDTCQKGVQVVSTGNIHSARVVRAPYTCATVTSVLYQSPTNCSSDVAFESVVMAATPACGIDFLAASPLTTTRFTCPLTMTAVQRAHAHGLAPHTHCDDKAAAAATASQHTRGLVIACLVLLVVAVALGVAVLVAVLRQSGGQRACAASQEMGGLQDNLYNSGA